MWREYIRKFKLADLFTTSGVSGLQTIEDMLNKRVKQNDVVGLDDTGAPTGEWIESIEFKQLQSRGLEIIDVRVHNVLVEPTIEEQIVQQWSAEWLSMAKREESQLKLMETLIGNASRDEASRSFAMIASQQFGGKTPMPQQNPFKTLQLLIQPLKEYLLSETTTTTNAAPQSPHPPEPWHRLLDNNPDGAQKQGGGNP